VVKEEAGSPQGGGRRRGGNTLSQLPSGADGHVKEPGPDHGHPPIRAVRSALGGSPGAAAADPAAAGDPAAADPAAGDPAAADPATRHIAFAAFRRYDEKHDNQRS